jgi:arabinogalactan endo-1,4-beta-galactosidase
MSSAFPSDYLKAADLNNRNVRVKIDRVEMKDIGGDHKPILYFIGTEKGMVLNKTNANNISIAYGDETDDWQGKDIILFEAMVDFQGKTVPAIRVRVPTAKDNLNYKQRGVSQMPPEPPPVETSDDIPF